MQQEPHYLSIAESIARDAQAGQKYGERDYIEAHVAPVVGMIARLGYGPEYKATAWLHDVVEDTDVETHDLTEAGIPLAIVTAVDLLSKKGLEHDIYIKRIGANSLATVTKYGDSAFNLANTLLFPGKISTARFRRKTQEYAYNIAYLTPRLPSPDG